jgi:acetoacetate decarboxylase
MSMAKPAFANWCNIGCATSSDLNPHALAPVAKLPVLEVLSATHIVADLTLPLGFVAHDYLNQKR